MEMLIFCGSTIYTQKRSGVQRVIFEVAKALMPRVKVSFVKWDELDGQLRYLDERDIKKLFCDMDDANQLLSPYCHRVAYRFGDTVNAPDSAWLLLPEIPYHLPSGNEIFARIISQSREYGIRSAAIFYDLIPIRDNDYQTARADHIAYLAELLRCDLVLPISRFASDDLVDFYASIETLSEKQLMDIRSRVVAIPLGENREDEQWGTPISVAGKSDEPAMVMVGTIEPRKQQTRLLKALNDAREQYPDLRRLNVEIFGSLHPASGDALYAELARNPKIKFRNYGSEVQIEQAYASAWFSAFPSRNEGYGLPVVESLRRGIPCLTSNFGSMAEIAAGGGCLAVDTMDDRAVVEALVRMISDANLRRRLSVEISSRPQRSWGVYAEDTLSVIQNATKLKKEVEESFCTGLAAQLNTDLTGGTNLMLGDIRWGITKIGAEHTPTPAPTACPPADRSTGKSAVVAQIIGETADWEVTHEQLLMMADADVLLLKDQQAIQTIAYAANKLNLAVSLPHHLFFGEDAVANSVEKAVRISHIRNAALRVAERDDLRVQAIAGLRSELPFGQCDLAIVISTFNRGPFVEMNVAWLLRTIKVARLNVRCVVVDNASTDDTYDRLSRFFGNRSFTYICNSANVGMLGNLRVSSALNVAKYVWLTGDDDYIVPGAIERTLAAIAQNTGIPYIFHNFKVYHREKINSHDSPTTFIHEARVLAKTPRPNGLYPVNQIAGEHDNLFTAIYPIVFKSDILAACFNYPFDGIPFGNLTESVPTTKIILGSYRYSKAYWLDQPGIAGNAHNSWAAHRPRWHLVLMPKVFDLARDAGVDPQKLWDWTKIHLSLFNDAVKIAISKKKTAHLDIPGDMDNAFRVFRKKVEVPKELGIVSDPPPPLW